MSRTFLIALLVIGVVVVIDQALRGPHDRQPAWRGPAERAAMSDEALSRSFAQAADDVLPTIDAPDIAETAESVDQMEELNDPATDLTLDPPVEGDLAAKPDDEEPAPATVADLVAELPADVPVTEPVVVPAERTPSDEPPLAAPVFRRGLGMTRSPYVENYPAGRVAGSADYRGVAFVREWSQREAAGRPTHR